MGPADKFIVSSIKNVVRPNSVEMGKVLTEAVQLL
jgi:hypothetical protein